MAIIWLRKAFWVLWFVAVAASFGTLESWNYEDGITLSRFVAEMDEAWPLFGPLLALGFGVLLSHFFWPWRHPGIKP